MRSQLIRLSFAGALAVALSACSDATNGVPVGGSPNGSGGGPVNTSSGIGAVPANSIPPKLIDDGTVTKGKYTGFNTTATDTQSPSEVPADAAAYPAFPNPPSPNGDTDLGSHSIAFAGNGSTQEIFGYGGTVPNLTYTFGPAGNTANYTYSTIVLHITYNPGATAPGTLSALSVELTGGSGSTAYDVRVPCVLPSVASTVMGAPPIVTIPTAFTTAASSIVTCTPVPAYPIAGFLPSNPNTLGPNAVTPGVTGQFTPTAPKLYLVLTYAAPTATAGSATLGVDDLYAKQ